MRATSFMHRSCTNDAEPLIGDAQPIQARLRPICTSRAEPQRDATAPRQTDKKSEKVDFLAEA